MTSEIREINHSIEKISDQLNKYSRNKQKVFVSSSFQSHSIPLLHILKSIDPNIVVYFLDTSFHFSETLIFRDSIALLLNLNLINVVSPVSKFNQRDQNGRFYFCSNSDYCCHLNKILPLEPALIKYDIWITGVRRDQSRARKKMEYESKGPFGTTRYHPMLDWNSKMIWTYRKLHELPEHPLEKEGYLSIGCEPCTQKHLDGNRSGRWHGQNKGECGLHTKLIG